MANTKKSKPAGPKPKRIRRKCSHPSCPNRVVQGGVCVTHGAKRKMCQHPGCDKAVKLAGYCSTHGPARKKCAQHGCTRVAVQGGRCLSHGAKRRVCKFPNEACDKNAIVGGMCKKHYDMMKDANGLLDTFGACMPIMGSGSGESEGTEVSEPGVIGGYAYQGGQGDVMMQVGYGENGGAGYANAAPLPPPVHQQPIQQVYYQHPMAPAEMPPAMSVQPPPPHQEVHPMEVTYRLPLKKKNKHPRHQRGLSIFEDMGTVDAIINSGAAAASQQGVVLPEAVAPAPPQAVSYGYPTPEAASMPPPPPPRSLPQVPSVSTIGSTGTPAPQVSFADSATASHPAKPASKPTEEEYYSPTIAIFEQMIKASEVIDNPSIGSYAGLSPPKLTPRGRRHVSFHDEAHNRRAAAAPRPPRAQYTFADLHRTVSHDEEHAHLMHHSQQPTGYAPNHPAQLRISSPTNEMIQPASYAPETPDLDNGPAEPMNIVSAGSHHGHVEGQAQVLLPKRNDGYEHLFIPRALS
jgi:hypothetical protein